MSEQKRTLLSSLWWWELVFGLVLVGVDQGSKQAFFSGSQLPLNRGGVFGLLPSNWWVFGLVAAFLYVLRIWYRTEAGWLRWSLWLVVIGGLGNLIDRVTLGGVRDFIFYPFFRFYGNVADVYLTLGVVGLIGYELLVKPGTIQA